MALVITKAQWLVNEFFGVVMSSDFEAILGRLMEAWRVENPSELMRALNRHPARVSTQRARGCIPEVWIDKTCGKCHVREEWVRTGRLPKSREGRRVSELPEWIQALLPVLERYDVRRQVLLAWCASLGGRGCDHLIGEFGTVLGLWAVAVAGE